MKWLYLQQDQRILNIETGAYFTLKLDHPSNGEYEAMIDYLGPVGGEFSEGIEFARTWLTIFRGTEEECKAQLNYLADSIGSFGYSQEGGTKREPEQSDRDSHPYSMETMCKCGHLYAIHDGVKSCTGHGCDCQGFSPQEYPIRSNEEAEDTCCWCDHKRKFHNDILVCQVNECSCKHFDLIPF